MTTAEDISRAENDRFDLGEPDLHLRFRYRTIVFDYRACRTATENLAGHWRQSHHPGVSLTILTDGTGEYPRLPCESAWLSRREHHGRAG